MFGAKSDELHGEYICIFSSFHKLLGLVLKASGDIVWPK